MESVGWTYTVEPVFPEGRTIETVEHFSAFWRRVGVVGCLFLVLNSFFWPGDFGFLGAKQCRRHSCFAPIARVSRSVGGHDGVNRALRQAHDRGDRSAALTGLVKFPDLLSVRDHFRPTKLLALLARLSPA